MNRFYYLIYFLSFSFFFFSCKKETEIIQQPIVDDYIFNVDSEPVYQSSAEKTKEKTSEQYVSILYSNLFQQSIPQEDLTDLSLIRTALGDKQLADELIINGLVNNSDVIIPTNEQMRDNVDEFIDGVYLRFFLRKPTAYEKVELKQEIENDLELTPEFIYTAFAISNEYKFY